MKIKLLLLFFLLTTFRILAEEVHTREDYHITAEEYCLFLNAVAAEDLNHLYDEKMASDLEAASILRAGVPGSYYYASKEGKEKGEVLFLSLSAMKAYQEWLQEREESLQKTDFLIMSLFKSDGALFSNRNSFYYVAHRFIKECSGEELGVSWEMLAEGVTLITSLAGGAERSSRVQGRRPNRTRIRIESSEERSSSEEEKSDEEPDFSGRVAKLVNRMPLEEKNDEESDSSWEISRLVNRTPFFANVEGAEERQPRGQIPFLRGARTRIDSSEECLSSESSDEEQMGLLEGTLHQTISAAQGEKERVMESIAQFSLLPPAEQEVLREDARCTATYWKEQKDYFNGLAKIHRDHKTSRLLENVISVCAEAEEAAHQLETANPNAAREEVVGKLPLPEDIKRENKRSEIVTLTPAQQEQMRHAIKQFAKRNELEKAQHRQTINDFLKHTEQTWGEHRWVRRECHERYEASQIAKATLEKTKEENSEERLSEKPLAQAAAAFEKVTQGVGMAGKVASVIGGGLAPVAPPVGALIVATGMVMRKGAEEASKGVPILETMNRRAAEYEIRKAVVRFNQAEEKEAEAHERMERAHDTILTFEKESEQKRAQLLAREHKMTALRAQQLRPQKRWGEYQWQQWVKNMLAMVGNSVPTLEEVILLAANCRSSGDWIMERTAMAWQERLDQSRLKLQHLEKVGKKRLLQLEKQREQLLEQIKQLQQESDALPDHEKEHMKQQEELERQIKAYDESESLYQPTAQEACYLENVASLRKIKEQLEQLPQKKEELASQLREIKAQEQRTLAQLIGLERKFDLYFHLAKACLQADQDQLRRCWPEYDLTFRPYLEWALPFASGTKAAILPLVEKSEEAIEPPLQLEEECEAQGRLYFYQAQRAAEEQMHSKYLIIQKEESSPLVSSPTHYETVLAWSLEQVNDPAPAEQERWKMRWRLDSWRHESNRLAQALLEEKEKEEPGDNKSIISWTGSLSSFSKMGFSTTPSSIMEAAFHAHFGTLVEEWTAARSKVKELEAQWLSLVAKAEQVRTGDQEALLEDSIDPSIIDAWANADRQAGKKYRHGQRLYQEKEEAEKRRLTWVQDNKRLEARAAFDKAKRELEELEKNEQQRYLMLPKKLRESQQLAEKKKIQDEFQQPLAIAKAKAQAAEREWRALANEKIALNRNLRVEEHGQIAETMEAVEALDRATLERWEQLQQKLHLESAEALAPKDAGEEEQDALIPLEKLWEGILIAQQEKEFLKAQEAALRYHEGEETPWRSLTSQERQHYNSQIQEKNILYKNVLEQEGEDLKRLQEELQQHQKKSKQLSVRALSFITGKQQKALTLLKEAQADYEERYQVWNQRSEILRLSRVTLLEREQYVQEQIKRKIKQWGEQLPELIKQEDAGELIDIYKRADQARVRGIDNAVENYYYSAQAWKRGIEAAQVGEKSVGALYEKIASLLGGDLDTPGAALMYSQAVSEESDGNAAAASAYRISAQIYKGAASALKRRDTLAVELNEKVARLLGGTWETPGAGYMYNQAAFQERNGNAAAAKALRRSAQAYGEAAAVFTRGDRAGAELHEKIARLLRGSFDAPGAASTYCQAVSEKRNGNDAAAEAYRKAAQAYEKAVTAFMRGDELGAEMQKKAADFLGGTMAPGAAYMYRLAVSEKRNGNNAASKAFHKAAQAYEEAAAALIREDEPGVEMQKKAADLLGGTYGSSGAAYMYSSAASAERQGNVIAAEAFRKSAQVYEEAAAALIRGDTTAVELYEKVANLLDVGVAATYSQISFYERRGNNELANFLRKSALESEAAAEKLLQEYQATMASPNISP